MGLWFRPDWPVSSGTWGLTQQTYKFCRKKIGPWEWLIASSWQLNDEEGRCYEEYEQWWDKNKNWVLKTARYAWKSVIVKYGRVLKIVIRLWLPIKWIILKNDEKREAMTEQSIIKTLLKSHFYKVVLSIVYHRFLESHKIIHNLQQMGNINDGFRVKFISWPFRRATYEWCFKISKKNVFKGMNKVVCIAK